MGAPWLAHRWGLGSWLEILGYVIGIGAPINALVRIIRDYNKSLKNDERLERPHDRHD